MLELVQYKSDHMRGWDYLHRSNVRCIITRNERLSGYTGEYKNNSINNIIIHLLRKTKKTELVYL